MHFCTFFIIQNCLLLIFRGSHADFLLYVLLLNRFLDLIFVLNILLQLFFLLLLYLVYSCAHAMLLSHNLLLETLLWLVVNNFTVDLVADREAQPAVRMLRENLVALRSMRVL